MDDKYDLECAAFTWKEKKSLKPCIALEDIVCKNIEK